MAGRVYGGTLCVWRDVDQNLQSFIKPTGHLDKRNSGKSKLNTLKDVPQVECTPVSGQIRLEWSDRGFDGFELETSFQIHPGVYN